MCAVKLRRKAIGCELNPRYFADAVSYCEAAEKQLNAPTLFDLLEAEADEAKDEEMTEALAV